MPALYTHYAFGNDVLNKVNKNLKEAIEKNKSYYNMFNQGFDNLYYYPFKWNYYRDFGISCHKKKIDEFFKNAINYIIDNNLQDDSTCTNMIYGIINHYTLDTIVHPYINYQVTNLNIPHTKIEFIYDAHLFKRRTNSNWNNKIYKELIPKLKFSKSLLSLLDYTFLTTHDKDNIGHILNVSHNTGYYIYRYFINDYYGIKKHFYKLVDIIIPKKEVTLSESTFSLREFNIINIFNPQKEKWHHPNDKNKTYNYTLDELYDKALKNAIKLNNLAYKVMNKKEDVNKLITEIKNISLDNI